MRDAEVQAKVCKPGVLVIHNRYQQAGGEDAVVRAEVALLRQRGHRVTEFTRDNAAIDRFGPMRKAALALSATWNQQVYIDLRRLIRKERPAVAHCHNLMPLISPGSLLRMPGRRRAGGAIAAQLPAAVSGGDNVS